MNVERHRLNGNFKGKWIDSDHQMVMGGKMDGIMDVSNLLF